jgi:hypothetical protein
MPLPSCGRDYHAHGFHYGRNIGARGYNRLVIDDPHGPNDAWSQAKRESAVCFIRESLFFPAGQSD